MVEIKLHDEWKQIVAKAWSFRIAIALAVFQAIEAGMQYYLSDKTPTMSIIGAFVALGGALSRIVAQENLSA